MEKRKAFTLIELLVVIAIIAILLAILMPALQRVKKQARDLMCRANLKEYGVAGRMYLDENNGNFPYSFTWLCQDFGFVGCGWHDETKNLDFEKTVKKLKEMGVENPVERAKEFGKLPKQSVKICPHDRR